MSDPKGLLAEFTADRLGLLERHEASARVVGHYDFNNTYQYVISREETHVAWLQSALAERGAGPLPARAAIDVPDGPKTGGRVDPASYHAILEDDARRLALFVEGWRPRVALMTQARHRSMLNVVLGETLEHQRLFQQAASGFEDLLGRRTGGVARTGGVLPTRWVE